MQHAALTTRGNTPFLVLMTYIYLSQLVLACESLNIITQVIEMNDRRQ